jgi:nicotinate-nucleotide pyrophosphorylase (carboxylating)
MMNLPRLSPLVVEPLVRAALLEDLGLAGDITSNAVVPEDHCSAMLFNLRQPGVIAGLDVAEMVFRLVDPDVSFERLARDGQSLERGADVARVSGWSRSILAGERTALNFLGHLSGIATATANLVKAVEGTKAAIVCTRKTTPGLRALQKYAVRAGGGMNHRFALYDAVLIKDNHIAVAGGVREAIERAKAAPVTWSRSRSKSIRCNSLTRSWLSALMRYCSTICRRINCARLYRSWMVARFPKLQAASHRKRWRLWRQAGLT